MFKDNEVNEVKQILSQFVLEQKKFNTEQKEFNNWVKNFISKQEQFNAEQRAFVEEQREFNGVIDAKIDKAQYFLEETIAENTKMFFEEQVRMKNRIGILENQI